MVSLILKCLTVPFLELADELGLLVIDGLLGKADLFLALLELGKVFTVLLFEFFELSKAL